MDKTGILVVVICALLLGWWFVEQTKEQERQAALQEQAREFAATNGVSAVTATATATAPAASAPTAPGFFFDTNSPEQTLVVTNRDARYTFTSRGGGLERVELLDYPETVSARWTKTKTAGESHAILNRGASVPSLAVLGGTNLTGDGVFSLARTDDGVRAEKLLPDGLRLVKEFHIGSNYLVRAVVRLENTTARPLALPEEEWVVGTAGPMDVDDRYFNVYGGVMWFNGAKAATATLSYFNPSTRAFFFFPRIPKTEYVAGDNNVFWAAANNQFFTLLAMTASNAPAARVVAVPVTLPAFSGVEQAPGAPLPEGVQMALVYPAQTLAANSSVSRQVFLFAGPKEYRTLAVIGERFQNHADDVMGFNGVFGFCAKPLLLAMNWLHDVTKIGYGWVIVLFTVMLRAIFWPLMTKSTRSMKKMQALAPELKALRDKYKDDPQKQTQKTWELYKKNKVSPMSGCLPMVIQMPVFFGFYMMLRSAIELRGASFLWVADLSKPDTLFMIPGLDFPFNLLPLLMVGAMLWQSHLTPLSPGMDPAQEKIMRYMPLIFLVFLYNYSAALALYMTVSTLLGVLQTKVTRTMAGATAPPAATPALTPPQKRKK